MLFQNFKIIKQKIIFIIEQKIIFIIEQKIIFIIEYKIIFYIEQKISFKTLLQKSFSFKKLTLINLTNLIPNHPSVHYFIP
jgi:hypothetical protein